MNGIIEAIRRRIAVWKAVRMARERMEITSRITVREHNGVLYICCGSTAIIRIADNESAKSITDRVARIRTAAVEFGTGLSYYGE